MAVDGWQLVLCRKLYESRAVKSGECIRKDDQPVGTRTSHGVECTLEFVGVPYFQGLEAHAQRRRCGFYDAQVGMQECAGRIPQDSQAGHCWDKFNEQLRLFGGNVRACIESDPRDVPPRDAEGSGQTLGQRDHHLQKRLGLTRWPL